MKVVATTAPSQISSFSAIVSLLQPVLANTTLSGTACLICLSKSLFTPAPAAEPEDSKVVGITKVSGPTTVVSMGADDHLQALDELITRHERELAALRIAREAYISNKQTLHKAA